MNEKNVTFFNTENSSRPMLSISLEHIPRIGESVVLSENNFNGEYRVVDVKTYINKDNVNVLYGVFLQKTDDVKVRFSFFNIFPSISAVRAQKYVTS